MKKVFKIEGLDCAHCAAKIEVGISKIDGVINAKVNFLTEKMIIEANDADFDGIIPKMIKVCKDVEPDCEVTY